jgi:Tfp pilus assembly protein PilF
MVAISLKKKRKERSKKKMLLSPNYLQRPQAHRFHAKIKNAVEMINNSKSLAVLTTMYYEDARKQKHK